MRYFNVALLGSLVFLFCSLGHLSAAETGGLHIELNSLEQSSADCRTTFVIQNQLEVPLGELALEIVLFDKDSKVIRFLVLNAGSLPKDKTRVKRFGIKNTQCANVDRVLINDVSRCKGDGLTPAFCLKALTVSNRSSAKFGL